MKKTLLLACVLFLALALQAQTFDVSTNQEPQRGYIGDVIKTPIQFKNTSNKAITLVIRKIETQIGSTQKNFLCADANCLEQYDEWTVRLEPGQNIQSLFAGLDAGLVPGISMVKYIVFNKYNPGEFHHLEFNFTVEEKPLKNEIYSSRFIKIHDVYPNPAKDFAHIEYRLLKEEVKARIVIHNILGSALADYELPYIENQVKIDTDSFTAGIYFYTLYLDNEGVVTRKLIVNK